ncbi:MAG: methylated-DNA--[protein]-cysteine S-methyltransferase [Elusimicrobia bacterium]|nr:methylated-DNA--[protein]-cysteine S-methyltransferase [Elusimicrobiota bacterium]
MEGMNDYSRIERVIRHLDAHHRTQPSLADLARVADVSEFHFHRLFSRWAGITPKGFLKALTSAHAKELLKSSRSVLDAALDAGLSGPGRLHDLLVTVDGVTPGEIKASGAGLEIHYGVHPTPFGPCLIAATPRGVCHLSFIEEEARAVRALRREWPAARIVKAQDATAKIVRRAFRTSADPSAPIRTYLIGSPFQLKVWQALLRVPPGRVASYGDVARLVGSPDASRAVGTALATNRVAYLIPCHRVIRETGVFGEYRWGAPRKRAILAWESR